MAISATHYHLIRDLFEHGLLPRGQALLEIGEANSYDIDPATLTEDINRFVGDAATRAWLVSRLQAVAAGQGEFDKFEIAKIFYEVFFAPSERQAIDFEGTPSAHRLDLNEPVSLERRFGIVINHGTAEHVFNIAQVFRTMHEYTLPGGMMIHESPFTGWIEHGFYNLQPTLFYDLAHFNEYLVLGMFVQDLTNRTILQIRERDEIYEYIKARQFPENSMLFTVLVKSPHERPFQIPIQGYYRQSLSPIGMDAWQNLR
ncbi:MAG TPA: hypothetical protein VL175_11605 [Pirellulales bacterium]|jgi:hypothetical protein|nr:hypothetical protein [Pirellulales bacterium]